MKKYVNPEIEIHNIAKEDIMTASGIPVEVSGIGGFIDFENDMGLFD